MSPYTPIRRHPTRSHAHAHAHALCLCARRVSRVQTGTRSHRPPLTCAARLHKQPPSVRLAACAVGQMAWWQGSDADHPDGEWTRQRGEGRQDTGTRRLSGGGGGGSGGGAWTRPTTFADPRFALRPSSDSAGLLGEPASAATAAPRRRRKSEPPPDCWEPSRVEPLSRRSEEHREEPPRNQWHSSGWSRNSSWWARGDYSDGRSNETWQSSRWGTGPQFEGARGAAAPCRSLQALPAPAAPPLAAAAGSDTPAQVQAHGGREAAQGGGSRVWASSWYWRGQQAPAATATATAAWEGGSSSKPWPPREGSGKKDCMGGGSASGCGASGVSSGYDRRDTTKRWYGQQAQAAEASGDGSRVWLSSGVAPHREPPPPPPRAATQVDITNECAAND
mmetsp:Transcript_182778/g.579082  ORF Transcript_182778/g.579082 Transcript_182778/m.579082 type:complete len:392 (-) Transcript_182778:654-1829(-)